MRWDWPGSSCLSDEACTQTLTPQLICTQVSWVCVDGNKSQFYCLQFTLVSVFVIVLMDKSQIRFSRVTLTSLKIFKCSCMFPVCLSDIQERICVWSLTGWGRSTCVILVSKGCDTVTAFMVLSLCPSIIYKNMTLQRGHDLLHPFSPAVGKVSVNSSCESMSSSERALHFLWLSYFSDFVLSVKQMFLWGHFSALTVV